MTREFLNPEVSCSGLDRCLRWQGVSNLQALIPQPEDHEQPKKTLKDYEPGFVHVDVKYLPRMPSNSKFELGGSSGDCTDAKIPSLRGFSDRKPVRRSLFEARTGTELLQYGQIWNCCPDAG
jgi:hypothetical protein